MLLFIRYVPKRKLDSQFKKFLNIYIMLLFIRYIIFLDYKSHDDHIEKLGLWALCVRKIK